MRCRFWTVISTEKFSEVLLSLSSLLQLSWGRPLTLSGKSHATHPWNRYLDQMTFRRQTWSAFDSANDTASLDSGLRHGNGLTEAVRQICNYIPVKTSSWILKSCWQSRSIFLVEGHRLYPMRLAQRGPLWSVRCTIHFKQGCEAETDE